MCGERFSTPRHGHRESISDRGGDDGTPPIDDGVDGGTHGRPPDTVNYYNRIQLHTPMPIDLRWHDPDDPITIRPETTKATIIELLYRDTNLGYTPAEIRTELDLPRGTASGTLSRLHDEGLVGKTGDGLYHGLDHREDLRRFARSLVSLETMLERHPEAAVDPADVEGTGMRVKRELPPERLERRECSRAEPDPDEWVDADRETEPDLERDAVNRAEKTPECDAGNGVERGSRRTSENDSEPAEEDEAE